MEPIEKYADLVKQLATMFISRMPANIELDDLIQAGMIGLHDAMQRFDPNEGVLFTTFANQRIKGAMLDELRGGDYLTRQSRTRVREIRAARRKLEQSLGRAPTHGEVARALEVTLSDYHQRIVVESAQPESFDSQDSTFVSLNLPPVPDGTTAGIEERQRAAAVAAAIRELSERQQLILGMLIDEGLSQEEIAAVLKVTPSRICQLVGEAVAKLRIKLRYA